MQWSFIVAGSFYDISVKHGNTGIDQNPEGLSITLKETDSEGAVVLSDISANTYFFFIKIAGVAEAVSFEASEIDVDALTSTVLVLFSLARVDALPSSTKITYELEERTATTEVTVLQGSILVQRGFSTNG
jgi:hypothetical protein